METDKFLGLPSGKSNLSKYENLYISSSVYTGLHYSKFQFYLFIKKKKVLRYFFRLTLTWDIETYISASTYVGLCNGKFRFDHPILEKALLHFNRIIIISI